MSNTGARKAPAGMEHGKRKINWKVLGRVVKMLFKSYPRLVPLAMVCIMFSAAVAAIPAIFIQKVLAVVTGYMESGNTDWGTAAKEILPKVIVLAGLYILSITFTTIQTQLMAYITQGFLCKMRRKMFDGMQKLPIRYFDTNKHGDIMSH